MPVHPTAELRAGRELRRRAAASTHPTCQTVLSTAMPVGAHDGVADAPTRPATPRAGRLVALVGTAVLLALLTLAVGERTGGFTYPLDDPYIHLSLSEQLRSGTYGLEPGVAASPSSSVLWPLLLVPTAGTPLHAATPLALTAASLLVSVAVLHGIVQRAVGTAGDRGLPAAAVTLAVVVTTNMVGLALTGMEHSLHVLAALLVVDGMARALDGERPTPATWCALALLPLVRYEGLAIAVPATVAFVVLGWRRPALIALATGAAGLLAFSGVLVALGLPPLPGSVLVKSAEGTADGPFAVVDRTLDAPLPTVLALAATAATWWAAARAGRPQAVVAASVAATLWLQVAFGPVGWLGRYEIWAVAYGLAGLLVVTGPVLRDPLRRRPVHLAVALAGVVVVASAGEYVGITARMPAAAAEIEAQHGTMAAFAERLDRPVAANDIGLLGYRSDHPVLDVWGLGSDDARRARAAGRPGWLAELVAAHGVDTVIVYREWFTDEIPADWQLVGLIGAAGDPVAIAVPWQAVYATTPEAADRARAALEAVAADRPDHVIVAAAADG